MSNQADNPLTRWVDDMQEVVKSIAHLIEENDRYRTAAESAQQEHGELREEAVRLRAEIQVQRSQAEQARRERDEHLETLTALRSENERLRTEQTEAGESAAKLLGEMKDLVNQVAHKFQGPSRTSPFSREPRSSQS